ncbi:unnamed protein product [Diplocarpon coronariae]
MRFGLVARPGGPTAPEPHLISPDAPAQGTAAVPGRHDMSCHANRPSPVTVSSSSTTTTTTTTIQPPTPVSAAD